MRASIRRAIARAGTLSLDVDATLASMPARRIPLDVSWHHAAACRTSPLDFVHPTRSTIPDLLATCSACQLLDLCRRSTLDVVPVGVVMGALVWSERYDSAKAQQRALRRQLTNTTTLAG